MKKKYNIKQIKNSFFIEESTYQSLNSKGFGSITGKNTFELSIYETAYLIEKEKATIENNKTDFENISKLKLFKQEEYIVYKDLKEKGHNIKTGLKFGFPFRVYEKGKKIGKDHSTWLIEVIKENQSLKTKDIIAKNRIAHSTRKKMIWAIVDTEKSVTYLENSWNRMN